LALAAFLVLKLFGVFGDNNTAGTR